MEILWFDELPSTQNFMINGLKKGSLNAPVAVVAKKQSEGIGSRGNSWIGYEGALFLSFAQKICNLPNSIPTVSASIYFGYLAKEFLSSIGSEVWLKWPNDLYIGDKKIGGIITSSIKESIVCGIGINLKSAEPQFGVLDINIALESLVLGLLEIFEKAYDWKEIFRKFSIEFYQSRDRMQSLECGPLNEALLLEDGSLQINGRRVFSLR